MKVTHKTLGLSVIALAAALLGSAVLADNAAAPPDAMPMMDGPMGGKGLTAADTDKDGKISKAEFEAWRASRMTAIDTDKDGKLSADEIAAARIKQVEADAKTMAERMVAARDTDGDGKLSVDELMSAPTPAFDKLDTNGDGVVDQAEMQAFRAAHAPMGGKMGHHRYNKGATGDQMPPADGAGQDDGSQSGN